MSAPTRPVYTRLSDEDITAAQRYAAKAQRSLSAWIADLVRAEILAQRSTPRQRDINQQIARVKRAMEE